MAIVIGKDFVRVDSRFKSWVRTISANNVDLDQNNGYSCGNQWSKVDDSVSLTSGEYLVCAAENGGRNSHSYEYALVGSDGTRIKREDRIAVINKALAQKFITEKQFASATNSTLYSYALYVVAASLLEKIVPTAINIVELQIHKNALEVEIARLTEELATVDANIASALATTAVTDEAAIELQDAMLAELNG